MINLTAVIPPPRWITGIYCIPAITRRQIWSLNRAVDTVSNVWHHRGKMVL